MVNECLKLKIQELILNPSTPHLLDNVLKEKLLGHWRELGEGEEEFQEPPETLDPHQDLFFRTIVHAFKQRQSERFQSIVFELQCHHFHQPNCNEIFPLN